MFISVSNTHVSGMNIYITTGTMVPPWILVGGIWNDNGVWDDTALWID